MIITIDGHKYPTILDALNEERIFNIRKDGDGFLLEESCDNNFCVSLSKDELLGLCDELRALAGEAE